MVGILFKAVSHAHYFQADPLPMENGIAMEMEMERASFVIKSICAKHNLHLNWPIMVNAILEHQ